MAQKGALEAHWGEVVAQKGDVEAHWGHVVAL